MKANRLLFISLIGFFSQIIVAQDANNGINIIKNGNFEVGMSNWNLAQQKGAVATFSVTNVEGFSGNAMKISIATLPENEWDLSLGQYIIIEEGKTYELTFIAKADSKRDVKILIQQLSPGNEVYFSQKVTLTQTPTTYKYLFKSSVSEPKVKFRINLGKNDSSVYFDNVMINQVNK